MKIIFIVAGLQSNRISFTFAMVRTPKVDNVFTDLGGDNILTLAVYYPVVDSEVVIQMVVPSEIL
jgi:hypothetical protein